MVRRPAAAVVDVRGYANERQTQPVVDDRRVDVAHRVHAEHVAATVRETRLLPLCVHATTLSLLHAALYSKASFTAPEHRRVSSRE